MRAILLVVFLSGGVVTMAQTATPAVPNQAAPNHEGIPNPDQLFRLPPAPGVNQPNFKWEIPEVKRAPWAPPAPDVVRPMVEPLGSAQDMDRGMVVHPPQGSFADRQARPAESSNLYPGLKILPTEMAQLEISAFPKARGIPIPTTWPNAKFESIPTTWDKFTMLPVGANLAVPHANAVK